MQTTYWQSIRNRRLKIVPILAFASLAAVLLDYPAPSRGVEFRGLYVASFEVSSFVPCGEGTPGSGEGYWLEAAQDSSFFDRYATIRARHGYPGIRRSPTVFTVFRGELASDNQGVIVSDTVAMSVADACP